MITAHADTGPARSLLRAIASGVGETMDDVASDGLSDLKDRMEPVTPVDTGFMQAHYTITGGNGSWELADDADYAGIVIRRQAGQTLNALLDGAEADLGSLLDSYITRKVLTTR